MALLLVLASVLAVAAGSPDPGLAPAPAPVHAAFAAHTGRSAYAAPDWAASVSGPADADEIKAEGSVLTRRRGKKLLRRRRDRSRRANTCGACSSSQNGRGCQCGGGEWAPRQLSGVGRGCSGKCRRATLERKYVMFKQQAVC